MAPYRSCSLPSIIAAVWLVCISAGNVPCVAAYPAADDWQVVQEETANQSAGDAFQTDDEPISDERVKAIGIFVLVSLVLFILSIQWLIIAWLLALGLASLGVIMAVEDVVIGIVIFVSPIALGVKEILGSNGES